MYSGKPSICYRCVVVIYVFISLAYSKGKTFDFKMIDNISIRSTSKYNLRSAIWVLISQWLERLTGDLKVVGSSPAWELRYFSQYK